MLRLPSFSRTLPRPRKKFPGWRMRLLRPMLSAPDAAKKPAQEHSGVNGKASAESELKQEKDAAADATEDLKKTSLEDKA